MKRLMLLCGLMALFSVSSATASGPKSGATIKGPNAATITRVGTSFAVVQTKGSTQLMVMVTCWPADGSTNSTVSLPVVGGVAGPFTFVYDACAAYVWAADKSPWDPISETITFSATG